MENFGDRLSVNDIWRVVLFVKTIPNGTLAPGRVPEPADYITWQPSKELLAWVEVAPEARGQRLVHQGAAADPFVQEAMRVFPGLSPADQLAVNGLGTPLEPATTPPPASRRSTSSCSTARGPTPSAAATSCRPPSQKDIPPTVEGQQ